MLIEFKIKNFRSFKEEQKLSLIAGAAGKDRTRSDSLIDSDGSKLVKAAAIYGANASGKSNLIRGLRFMDWFVTQSATRMNLGETIRGAIPFRLDETWASEPSRFEVTVALSGTRYVYGFAVTAENVVEEWLRAKPAAGRMSTWLSRRSAPGGEEWELCGPLQHESLLREKTRKNGLALSRGADLNISALSELYLWFVNSLWIYDLSFPPVELAERTAKRVREDEAFRARVLKVVRDADFGISALEVSEESSLEALKDAPEEIRKVIDALKGFVSEKDQLHHPVRTFHSVAGTEKTVAFRMAEDESMGTQRFFAIAGPVLDALDRGQTLVLDEFECSVHPLLSRKIVELFQSPTANKSGAQLVFATHDASLMSPKLLRRDQVWFTEKDKSGATELFSLYDFADRPRATSAFARNYFAGRYGAVPRFGRSLEDLEVSGE